MPAWHHTINLRDVWNKDVPFETTRDNVVEILRKDLWLEDNPYVSGLVRKLSETTYPKAFDLVFSDIYDEADADRVWISTF